jgi:hydrogenase-4 component B
VEYQNIVSGYGASDLAVFMKAVEYLFLFSGGLTVAYITKLFVVLFIEKNDDEKVQAEFDGKKEYASSVTKIAVALCALPIPFIGVLPNIVARKIAGYGFVDSYINYMYEFENASVNYFSLKNLSGAVISIVVGAVVYVLVVRLWMLHKKEVGYREIYPKWLDMEKYIYRAVFYTAVPFVLGIISRILDSVVDIVVVFLRHTVYCDRELPYELPEGNHLGHDIGRSMERIYKLYCGIVKKEYKPKNYEHKIAIIGEDLFENMMIIERSLSFGLFMFCVGLGLTLMYLLMVN